MALQSRYFHAELPSGSRVTCFWGTCFYPIGAYWNYPELRRITLTLTSASGPVDNMSMYSWTGTLPSVTPVTAENFLSLGSSPAVGAHATADFPPGSDGFSIEIKAGDSAYPLDVRVDFNLAPGDAGYCQYGTRIQPAQQEVAIISDAAIAAAAILVPELAFLAIAWSAILAGATFVPGLMCAGPPPAMPLFTDADFILGTGIPAPGSFSKFMQSFQAAAWPLYCECLPATGGGSAPIDWPGAADDPQPHTPGPVAPIVCDNGDICATLDAIQRQLLGLATNLQLNRSDVRLIQRQKVPFAYLPGTNHVGLTGNGTFTVSGILGLSVAFSATPPGLSSDVDSIAPSSYFLGWINLGTVDGWLRKIPLVHNPQLILDVEATITTVEYELPPLTTAAILELRSEP